MTKQGIGAGISFIEAASVKRYKNSNTVYKLRENYNSK